MRVITVLNQKGGVGKTSMCHHAAGALSALGRRVLLVDNDPQASLTQGLWGPAAAKALDPSGTIAALYAGDAVPLAVVRPSGVPGVDLIPGSRAAEEWNAPRPHLADRDVRHALVDAMEDLGDRYDLALIDCPPNLYGASWAALAASDDVLVPLQPEDYGAQGIADVLDSIARVRSAERPTLRLLGFVLTMVKNLAIHKQYDEMMRTLYGPQVFNAVVPALADYPEAISHRKPVTQFKPRCKASREIRAVVNELLSRIAATAAEVAA